MFLRAAQIFGVHVAKQLICFHACVEVLHELVEPRRAPDCVVKRQCGTITTDLHAHKLRREPSVLTGVEGPGPKVGDIVVVMSSDSQDQLKLLGDFIRSQRKAAEMTLRELAAKANVSNPYISQIERGLHEPSMRVLRSISSALNLPIDTLLVRTGLIDEHPGAAEDATASVEAAIVADPNLAADQRESLLAVYRSYVAANKRA